MGWRQPEVTALLIRSLARAGLAWNVRQVPEEALERRRRPVTARADAGGGP